MSAYAKKVYLTEEQNQRLSPEGLLASFREGINSLSEEYVAQFYNGRYVWVRVEVNLLQKPGNGEIMAFIYNHDVTRESKLKQILECIMTFGYDEIYTVDEYSGQMDENEQTGIRLLMLSDVEDIVKEEKEKKKSRNSLQKRWRWRRLRMKQKQIFWLE